YRFSRGNRYPAGGPDSDGFSITKAVHSGQGGALNATRGRPVPSIADTSGAHVTEVGHARFCHWRVRLGRLRPLFPSSSVRAMRLPASPARTPRPLPSPRPGSEYI